jgi:DNA-binding MarR family transcriptional regulator
MSAGNTNEVWATGPDELVNVSRVFNDQAALPWMLASAAIVRAHKILASRVTAVLGGVGGLSMARYEVLGLLYAVEGGELAVRELKLASFLHPPTLTYILDWLEERDLVVRKGNREDRRSVLIQITESGRALFEKATIALGEVDFGLQGLSKADANAVARYLGRVDRAWDNGSR